MKSKYIDTATVTRKIRQNALEKLTDAQLAAAQKLYAQQNPLNLVERQFLSIKTKSADLVKLQLNPTQKIIVNKIKGLLRAQKLVRLWILKARQEGVSTLIEAIIYAYASQAQNLNALILADEKEHANNLFEMSKLYHERLTADSPYLAPALKKSNEKKLEFDGTHSQIIIASAENEESARSHTFQFVHLSECAFFRNFRAVMLGLNQSVPDVPGSVVIGETTANGINEFYDEWIRSVEGKTAWTPVFIPWFYLPEYSLPIQGGQMIPIDGIIFDAETSQERFLREERQLQRENQLSDAQINWRRWAIINKCGGSVTAFRQEYPATWQEAFQMSGANFFDSAGLEKQIPTKPLHRSEIFEEHLKFQFRDLPHGRLKIYEEPRRGEEYLIALDASEAVGQDEASLLVLSKRTNVTICVANGNYAPEDLAHLGIMAANYYNKALIIPENKSYGYMVCQLIYARYGNIYRRKITKTGSLEKTEELGYNTNSVTRPEYLALMAEEIRARSTELKDADLISQCQTFIINPKNNKPEAAGGKQDGLVICRAIAGKVRQECPYVPRINDTDYSDERRRSGYGFRRGKS